MNKHLQFLWANFDKIILVFLLVVLVGVHVHMIAAVGNVVDPSEASQVNWLENIIGQILAALLTLLVTQKGQPKDSPEPSPVAGAGSNAAADAPGMAGAPSPVAAPQEKDAASATTVAK